MSRGGDKLKAALTRRLEEIQQAQNKVVRVGVIENQHYDDETPVAYIAAIHEYGCEEKNIKPRPFFRPTIKAQEKEWKKTFQLQIKNGFSITQAMDSVGLLASSDVAKTISEIHTPKLETSTLIARNRKAYRLYANGQRARPDSISIKPLVDDGDLIDSISYQIVDKEGG